MPTFVFSTFEGILLFTPDTLLIHCCVGFLLDNKLDPICKSGFLGIGKSGASASLTLVCI